MNMKTGFAVAAVVGLTAIAASLGVSPAKADIIGGVSLTGLDTNETTAHTIAFNPAGAGVAQIQNSTAFGVLAPLFPSGGTTDVTMIGAGAALDWENATDWVGKNLFGSSPLDDRITSFNFSVNAAGTVLSLSGNSVFVGNGVTGTPGVWLLSTGLDPSQPNVPFPSTFSATALAVPGPIVGAGLPGLIAALGGLVAMAQRRRKQLA